MVKEFKAARAIQLAPGKVLTSSFDAPECLKNGPFTIYYEVANENPSPSVPILTWGTAESRFARVFFGTYDDNRKCMTWATGGGAWADRPPEGKPFLAYPAGNTVMASYWKKFAIAYDGAKMTLYLNGTRIRGDAVQYSQDAPGKLVIGFQNGPEEAKLLLRDLRIFDKALAEADVKQLCKERTATGASAPVWFSAEGLAAGKRARAVDNQGTLKGRFSTDPDVDRAPEVKELGGRRCVAFNGAAMMQSDLPAPRAVLDDHPFTLEMLAWCEEDNDSRVMAFTQEITRRHTSFAAGRGSGNRGLAREVRSVNWGSGESTTGNWVRLAWVYDGGPESTVRLYRDGKLNSERSFMSLDTIGGYPMTIGGMMHPGLGEKYLFKGGIAEIRIYDYPRTSEEIAAAAP